MLWERNMRVFVLPVEFVGHRVIAVSSPWVASQQSLACQIETF